MYNVRTLFIFLLESSYEKFIFNIFLDNIKKTS